MASENTIYPPHVPPPRYPIVRRAVAAFLDQAFVFLVILTFYRFSGQPGHAAKIGGSLGLRYYLWFGFMFWFLYLPFLEFILSATVGKWLVGLTVVSADRSKPLLQQTLKRHLLDGVDIFYFGVVYLFHPRSQNLQRLGDKWAGTVVKLADKKAKPSEQFSQ